MINLKSIIAKTRATSTRAIFGLVIACFMGLASQASALTDSSSEYLGIVVDGIPSSEANEVIYINTLIGLTSPSGPTTIGTETYTRSANTPSGCCDTAVVAGGSGNVTTSSGAGIDVTGFEYLVGKYDASNAGLLVWYVGNLSGLQSIPDSFGTCGSSGCGLSHYALFNPSDGGGSPGGKIPEPSALILMGSGLLALGSVARRFTNKK